MLRHSGCREVGNLLSPFLLDSMMVSLSTPWSDTCFPSSPRFRYLILDDPPRGYGVGKPSLGMHVMLGIYSGYNEYLSVWLSVAYDGHKSYHGLRLYLDVSPWMM